MLGWQKKVKPNKVEPLALNGALMKGLAPFLAPSKTINPVTKTTGSKASSFCIVKIMIHQMLPGDKNGTGRRTVSQDDLTDYW